MISEEDINRISEARTCDGCLDWHKYCKSECCKSVFLKVDPKVVDEPGKYLDIPTERTNTSLNDRWYYKLRGVPYIRGLLRFRKSNIIVVGRRVIYIRTCDLLTDEGKCKGHPDKKPILCKLLNLETAQKPHPSFEITPNCLFKYKSMEVVEHGEEDRKEKD